MDYSFYLLDSLEIWFDRNSTYYHSLSKSPMSNFEFHIPITKNLQNKVHPSFDLPYQFSKSLL